jgi:hypothetical protein
VLEDMSGHSPRIAVAGVPAPQEDPENPGYPEDPEDPTVPPSDGYRMLKGGGNKGGKGGSNPDKGDGRGEDDGGMPGDGDDESDGNGKGDESTGCKPGDDDDDDDGDDDGKDDGGMPGDGDDDVGGMKKKPGKGGKGGKCDGGKPGKGPDDDRRPKVSMPQLLYGKYEIHNPTDPSKSILPELDACNGHFGFTPESPNRAVYHYHTTDHAPFTFGCYGPDVDGDTGEEMLVTVGKCREIDADCGVSENVATVERYGGKQNPEWANEVRSVQYNKWCSCFDGAGENVYGEPEAGTGDDPTTKFTQLKVFQTWGTTKVTRKMVQEALSGDNGGTSSTTTPTPISEPTQPGTPGFSILPIDGKLTKVNNVNKRLSLADETQVTLKFSAQTADLLSAAMEETSDDTTTISSGQTGTSSPDTSTTASSDSDDSSTFLGLSDVGVTGVVVATVALLMILVGALGIGLKRKKSDAAAAEPTHEYRHDSRDTAASLSTMGTLSDFDNAIQLKAVTDAGTVATVVDARPSTTKSITSGRSE